MKKLNILYFTVDVSKTVYKYTDYFKQEISKLKDVEIQFVVNKGGDIKKIINGLDSKPDFIFIDNFIYHINNETLTGLGKIDIPKGLLYVDIQRKQEKFHNFVKKSKIDLLFSHYRDAFLSFFPEYQDRFRWLPFHCYTKIYHDYRLEKEINYLLMGRVNKKYPLRQRIVNKMSKNNSFVYHKHPGGRSFTSKYDQNKLIGQKYAKEINKAKMFFTCDSIYKYPLLKYFEVPGCHTLLLASGSQELRDLGFIDQKTFVEINAENFVEKSEYYLKNKRERKKIARRGYEMVVSVKHSPPILMN